MREEAVAVLERLAELSPSQFLPYTPSGQAGLLELYEQAAAADLVPSIAGDNESRLHGLWDVALDTGMGSLVRDCQMQCDLDIEYVRRWVQKALDASRSRLASHLSHGYSGGAGALAKELGRLQMVRLIAQGLPPAQALHANAASAAAYQAAGASHIEPAELTDATQLLLCARVLVWLSQQSQAFERPCGRFYSEQQWRYAVSNRREGAKDGLFLADMLAELSCYSLPGPGLAYPPASLDTLLSALFFAPASSSGAAAAKAGGGGSGKGGGSDALHARLALLAYYLSDGGFMTREAIVDGMGSHFGVPPATASCWILQQLLDASQEGEVPGAAALQLAAAMVPAVDGGSVPHKVLQVFVAQGRPAEALCLLRQRPEAAGRLEEAAAALAVRLQAGLLSEAILGLKRHLALASTSSSGNGGGGGSSEQVAPLIEQLMRHAAASTMQEQGERGSLMHAVARMPFDAAEEQAAVAWLEREAGRGDVQASLMLPLYYLLRGRTPEALHAYSRFCPTQPASQQQADLAALLTEAARMLPATLRTLVVRHGAEPGLQPAAGAGGGGGMEEDGDVALMGALPGDVSVAGDVAPAMLAVGPSPLQTPLVGSLAVLMEHQRMAAAAPAPVSVAGGGSAKKLGATAVLHQPPAAGLAAAFAAAASPAPSAAFGSAGGAAAAAGGGSRDAAAHELDRVLGMGSKGRPVAAGGRGGKRRWAGGTPFR